MDDPEEILKLSKEKAIKIDGLIDTVEGKIKTTSNSLTRTILKEFLEKLNVERGRITNNVNKTVITLFNQAYNSFLQQQKAKLIKSILNNISSILSQNQKFYKNTVPNFNISASDMERIVNRRLGIAENGTLIQNGYMSSLLDDTGVKADIQKYVFKEMFKGTSYEALKTGLQEFIVGDENKYGVFQKHYRTFTYDVYAQLNRFISGQYAQKLGLTHFIYNGGLIKTSREFCIHRNGKVFSTEEAEDWVNDPELTAIPSKENYNWLIDFGGYNCRHNADFIADEVAFALRPDLNNGKKRI